MKRKVIAITSDVDLDLDEVKLIHRRNGHDLSKQEIASDLLRVALKREKKRLAS